MKVRIQWSKCCLFLPGLYTVNLGLTKWHAFFDGMFFCGDSRSRLIVPKPELRTNWGGLLMEEILQQLIGSLSHYLHGIPGGAGFLPSTGLQFKVHLR